jgi:hypothetical protein
MILYHGSNTEIINISLDKCRPYKDFGRGFYLTTMEEQALTMANRVSRLYGGIPYTTYFEFDEKTMENDMLNIKKFFEPSVEWAMFVLNNRNRSYKILNDINCNQDSKYDIVTGPVANDDIVLLFRNFTNGYIDVDALLKGMRYKKLTDQYSFHTVKATKYLKKAGVIKYG